MTDAAKDNGRMFGALVALSAVAMAVRLIAARRLGFGDSEALYASYALHPQPAYLDHPGLIGVVARALGGGTAPSPLAAHTMTAVVATAAPWLVVAAARAMGASFRAAAVAAIGVLVVPEVALGLFAMTPDLLLFAAWVLTLGLASYGLGAPASGNRAAASLVLAGLVAGIGCASKVSAFTLVLALVATYAGRGARAHAKTVWPWLGLLAGLVVVAPAGLYEAHMGWPMLRHRLIDSQASAGLSLRNAGALLLGQAAYLSPLMAVAAVLVARDLWRSRDQDVTSRLLANATFLPLAVLVPLCLWSRVAEPHWIAPALLALPLHFARRMTDGAAILSRRFARASVATAAAFTIAAHAWVLAPSLVAHAPASYDARFDIANELYGWTDVARAVRRMAIEEQTPGGDPLVVVGPHWVVCAQLQAALHDELAVGCAGQAPSDFDQWLPRKEWERVDTLLFVTDRRFDVDLNVLFPGRARTRESHVTIMRGGKVARVFTIAVLEKRGAA